MEKTTLTITLKKQGKNEFWELRNQLFDFAKKYFNLLYEGAVRLDCYFPENNHQPKRIKIGETFIKEHEGLIYADGHLCESEQNPTHEQLVQTVKDIQTLIDEAEKDIVAPFNINIINNN